MNEKSRRGVIDDQGLWTHCGSKFTIGTIDGEPVDIVAQYNPKELAFSSSASWSTEASPFGKCAKKRETHARHQYGSTDPRILTVELLFDGYEENISIAPQIEALEHLTLPIDPTSDLVWERRPQLCVAILGKLTFRCIVQTVVTKVTMFDANGKLLRATCTVTLKEADVVAMLASERHGDIAMDAVDARVAARSEKWKQLAASQIYDLE